MSREVETAPNPEPTPMDAGEKEALAGKISDDFAKAMGTDEELETPAAEETPSEPAPEAAAEETETPAAEPEPETPAAEAAPTPKAGPSLPAAYKRTLEWAEWTPEEIAALESDPDQLRTFLPTIDKLHQTRNKELAAFAEAGRKAKEAKQQQTQALPAQPPASATISPISAEQVKKLKDEYGEGAHALIDTLVGPLNQMAAQLQQALPVVQETQARAQQAQAEMWNRQIDGFFADKSMAAYAETYGAKPVGEISPEQVAQRNKVLEYADALMGGASMQGRSISFGQAMQAAHDAISGGLKEQAARKQIASQLQKRQAGLSLKPGARGSQAPTRPSGGPPSKKELENRVKKSLATVLGGA